MKQEYSNFKYHTPINEGLLAVKVTRENVGAVAREIGGKVEEDAKSSDPTDVAIWVTVPTLDGPKRCLVTTTGPVIGQELATGRVCVWEEEREFYAEYKEPKQ